MNINERINSKKALIMGNGPSLDTIDFDLLKSSKVTTFACNRIAKICKKNNWYPDFYAAFFAEPFRGTPKYPGTAEQAIAAREDINFVVENKKTMCHLHHWYKNFLPMTSNVKLHDPVLVNRHRKLNIDVFENYKTPEYFLWHIAVTPLFQLCFEMGFEEIAIIGQDGHKIGSFNHFKDYTGPDQDQKKMERGNNRISNLQDAVKKYADNNNVSIVNLSSTSIIKHYPIVEIKEYLK